MGVWLLVGVGGAEGGETVSNEYYTLWKPDLMGIIKLWYPPNTGSILATKAKFQMHFGKPRLFESFGPQKHQIHQST